MLNRKELRTQVQALLSSRELHDAIQAQLREALAAERSGGERRKREVTKRAAANRPTGRVSRFAGKALTAIVKENPRREGTHGYHSMDVILKSPGIKYEAFIEKGGRLIDLLWDVEHKHVKAK